MRTSFKAVALVATAFMLAACPGDNADDWAGSIDTLASGVIHVRNPATPMWDSASAWRVEETLRIGDADGNGPAMFGSGVAIVADSQGRIHVLDRQAKDVRTFAPDGRHLRTIGRVGQGPGEFTDPNGLAVDPQGRLWVSDPRNSRYSVFDTAGVFVTSHNRSLSSFSYIWDGGIDSEGRLYESHTQSDGSGGFKRGAVRFNDAMLPTDTGWYPRGRDPVPPFQFTSGNSQMMWGVPFAPVNVASFDPRGYIWAGWSENFSLAKLRLTGDTIRIVEAPVDRIPVTSEERAAAIAPIRRQVGEGVAIDESRIPQAKPAFEGVQVDPDEYVWVRRPAREGDTGTTYMIFDPEGRMLGTLMLPVLLERYMPTIIEREAIYGVTRDDLGALNVVRLRLDRT
jgi:sugar lactone lactonase YvrE